MAKGGSTKAVAFRLPPLPKLRVRRPDAATVNPCLAIMSSVLTCWASSGHGIAGCAAVEDQLRACMDTKRVNVEKKNVINYHLSRMYPMIAGPRKRK